MANDLVSKWVIAEIDGESYTGKVIDQLGDMVRVRHHGPDGAFSAGSLVNTWVCVDSIEVHGLPE